MQADKTRRVLSYLIWLWANIIVGKHTRSRIFRDLSTMYVIFSVLLKLAGQPFAMPMSPYYTIFTAKTCWFYWTNFKCLIDNAQHSNLNFDIFSFLSAILMQNVDWMKNREEESRARDGYDICSPTIWCVCRFVVYQRARDALLIPSCRLIYVYQGITL